SVGQTGWRPDYDEYLTDVLSSGRHLLDLIDAILDLSRIEAGQFTLSPAPVDVGELIGASLVDLSNAARDSGVALSVHLPAEKIEVPGDSQKLGQALLNVLSNAVKFTPAGGSVSISARLD